MCWIQRKLFWRKFNFYLSKYNFGLLSFFFFKTHLCVWIYIEKCYLCPFKSSYELLDSWMEWNQKGTIFLPNIFSPIWSHLWGMSHINLSLELKEEQVVWNVCKITITVGVESTWEKYGTFLNSFHPEVKWLIRKLEEIKDKIEQTQSSCPI